MPRYARNQELGVRNWEFLGRGERPRRNRYGRTCPLQNATWSAVTRAALRAGRGTAFRPVRAKAASRGIPLAAALQIRSPDSRGKRAARCAELGVRN